MALSSLCLRSKTAQKLSAPSNFCGFCRANSLVKYRHRAVPLGHGCVLVSTGRVDSRHISQGYLVWSRRLGWVQCVSNASKSPPATYGAVFVATNRQSLRELPSQKQGILAGGMSSDAVLLQEVWQWELEDFSGPVSVPMSTT
jgi:hypothetical protein